MHKTPNAIPKIDVNRVNGLMQIANLPNFVVSGVILERKTGKLQNAPNIPDKINEAPKTLKSIFRIVTISPPYQSALYNKLIPQNNPKVKRIKNTAPNQKPIFVPLDGLSP
jgi:hypothetical protein